MASEATYSITHSDCLADSALGSVQDHSIDLVLADLPYHRTQNIWDCLINLEALGLHLFRIIKPKGVIALFSQQPFTNKLIDSYESYFRYELIWIKEKPTQFFESNKRPLPSHENIEIFSLEYPTVYYPQKDAGDAYVKKKNKKVQGTNYGKDANQKEIITVNEGNRFPTSLLYFPRDNANCGVFPTQKPLDLCRWLIRSYTHKYDVVLDCCMGSGSTIISALIENRNAIGYEIDQSTFDLAKQRISMFEQYGEDRLKKIPKIAKSQQRIDAFI